MSKMNTIVIKVDRTLTAHEKEMLDMLKDEARYYRKTIEFCKKSSEQYADLARGYADMGEQAEADGLFAKAWSQKQEEKKYTEALADVEKKIAAIKGKEA